MLTSFSITEVRKNQEKRKLTPRMKIYQFEIASRHRVGSFSLLFRLCQLVCLTKRKINNTNSSFINNLLRTKFE